MHAAQHRAWGQLGVCGACGCTPEVAGCLQHGSAWCAHPEAAEVEALHTTWGTSASGLGLGCMCSAGPVSPGGAHPLWHGMHLTRRHRARAACRMAARAWVSPLSAAQLFLCMASGKRQAALREAGRQRRALLKWPDTCLRLLIARTASAWAAADGTHCLQHGSPARGPPQAPVTDEWSCYLMHCWHGM